MGRIDPLLEPMPEALAVSMGADLGARFAGRREARRGDGAYVRWGKRAFDILAVLAALPLVLPIILILALAVMADGGAPIYGHRRVGRGGRTFRCWKLRSMVRDAEARLAAHLEADEAARAEWAATFKLARDPRITRVGRVLRALSLDELPQVWNILRGDMSLVGPRPVTPGELVRYGRAVRDYTTLRPGLTGLWQVSGRNALSYDQRVALDVAYARGVALATDLRIVLNTFGAVVSRTGR